ncbi:MAG: hypothetical protein R3B06_30985 [Kofleriaceae bacterium]
MDESARAAADPPVATLTTNPRGAVERVLTGLGADDDGIVTAPLDAVRHAVRAFTAELGAAIHAGHGDASTWRRWQTDIGRWALATRGMDGEAPLPNPALLVRALDAVATDLVRHDRTAAGLRNAWDGESIIRFRAPRYEHATLRPDPRRALAQLRAERQIVDPNRPWLRSDVTAALNFVTQALQNDLPTPNRRDTAAIWDSWRRTILEVAPELRRANSREAFSEAHRVDAALGSLSEKLVEAQTTPGEVGGRYCPWAADFFVPARLYPEAS